MFVDTVSNEVTPEMKQLLKDSVSTNPAVAGPATFALKAALSMPLKQGILFGDTVSGIFQQVPFNPGEPVEFPLDAIPAAQVKLHIAYTMPHEGYVPQRTIEADYVTVKTFRVATSVDWSREVAKFCRWDIVGRAMQVADAGLIRKRNNDGFHTLLAAAVDRGLSIYDSTAASGLFTKRLIALAQTVMRRNAGGNSTSINRGKLTHVCLSPEMLHDIRSWDVTQIDEFTRKQIFDAGDDMYSLTKIFGVTLVDIDEFGAGQEYENYYEGTLAATVPGSKSEIMLGLDLTNGLQDSFVMPWIKQDNGQFWEMHDDPTLLRYNKAGFYKWGRYGVSILDSRRVLILAA